jgi:hypothetical protein
VTDFIAESFDKLVCVDAMISVREILAFLIEA